MAARIEGQYAREVKFWLDLSNFFYESFIQLKRHYGPLWFVINVLAKLTDEQRTFGQLLNELEDFPIFGKNATSDLTNWIEHLRAQQYVTVFAEERSNRVNISKPRKRNEYFHVEHGIALGALFEDSYTEYVKRVCEELFGWEARERVGDQAKGVFNAIFQFVLKNYLPLWDGLLDGLAGASSPEAKKTARWVRSQMEGSAEYYVLLHVLWVAGLRGGASIRLTKHGIYQRCHRVRALSEPILNGCIDFLERNRLVEMQNGKYKLRDTCLCVYRAYGEKFLMVRDMLRSSLLELFPSLAS